MAKARNGKNRGHVRYAVVGLGHFAQVAILPAFKHAGENSELVALVSDDPRKLKKLGNKYGVEQRCSIEAYDALCASGEIDAVYIALPNSLHCDYAVRAANAGVHVLCEKPLAVTVEECERMIAAARENDVRLMTAYRLHFEEGNLTAVEAIQRGRIGEPRIFSSVFSMQVSEGNIRVDRELGGGPMHDLGVYCINAARYLFRAEPFSVVAFAVNDGEARFEEIDEAVSVILKFPGDRLAQFTVSFGAADEGWYEVVGTDGTLCLSPSYTYHEALELEVTARGKTKTKRFGARDQIAPEILHLSECVLRDRDPEPNGREGLADVRVVEAIHESLKTGRAVSLPPFEKRQRPSLSQEEQRPPVRKPETVGVQAPSKE